MFGKFEQFQSVRGLGLPCTIFDVDAEFGRPAIPSNGSIGGWNLSTFYGIIISGFFSLEGSYHQTHIQYLSEAIEKHYSGMIGEIIASS